jgi:L-cysteine desulfidase
MLAQEKRKEILALMKREIVPATGCTEPVAVALCAAHAASLLGDDRTNITGVSCRLSANIVKNAMGVGIPGTGMSGLPIAVAMGALFGDPERSLDVLSTMDVDQIGLAKAFVERDVIDIAVEDRACDILHIDVTVKSVGHSARAVISGSHTRLVHSELDGVSTFDLGDSSSAESGDEAKDVVLDMKTVWDMAMTAPLYELSFILESKRLNMAAADLALAGTYGHCVGRTIGAHSDPTLMGDCRFSKILSRTAAACDARMGGAVVPVMSNSGSGNQGIAATVPVCVYAEEIGADNEQLIRALTLSHLTVIYIKQSLGRLSALCGCVVAASGSAAGICYLMGGDYNRVTWTIKNMVANLTGMICDGAKPACALKLTSGISTAVISAMMAIDGHTVSSLEGIVDNDIDRTVANLTEIGRDAMTQTDRLILSIMTHKK